MAKINSKQFKTILYASLVLVFIISVLFYPTQTLDTFVTKDQQGRWYFDKQDYKKAAERFQIPLWKGTAYYLNENFKLAEEYFSRIDSVDGLFNMANSLAHERNYVLARRIFEQILSRQADHTAALNNKKILREIMDEINALSASQNAEPGESSKELGDEPQTAEGSEKQVSKEQLIDNVKQVTAEEILQDGKINEMWLRRVQSDPANFLATKFYMQLLNFEQHNKDEIEDE